MELPVDMNFRPLAPRGPGRRKKAGDCYSKGLDVQSRQTKKRQDDLRRELDKFRMKVLPTHRLTGKQSVVERK